MSTVSVTIKEDAIKERIAQKIAEYWNGRTVTVSGGVGASWSDWYGENWGQEGGVRKRVPGTRDRVSAITGTIHATASGDTVTINIDYQVQIQNIG